MCTLSLQRVQAVVFLADAQKDFARRLQRVMLMPVPLHVSSNLPLFWALCGTQFLPHRTTDRGDGGGSNLKRRGDRTAGPT